MLIWLELEVLTQDNVESLPSSEEVQELVGVQFKTEILMVAAELKLFFRGNAPHLQSEASTLLVDLVPTDH